MDHRKLITLVAQCPPLWDRSHDKFRDQSFKASLWNKIGVELSSTGPPCREAFKALREKYIREREKLQHYGSNYRTWELLEYLQFLDPYIITRKSSNGWTQQQEVFESTIKHNDIRSLIKQDPTTEKEEQLMDESDSNCNGIDASAFDFCKSLIKLVRDSQALWDRHSRDYHDKQLKESLWTSIAQMLNSDVNSCTLRWKGLREKYIRQKQKYSEGMSGKWEFLDELSFLDTVIQYRKKHWQVEESSQMFATNDSSCNLSTANSDFEGLDEHTNDSSPNNQPSSSTNTYHQPQVPENTFTNTTNSNVKSLSNNNSSSPNKCFNNIATKSHTPDSTLDVSNGRKRASSDAEEVSSPKKDKNDTQERTPEQIFGELVAAMLATKPDNEKNLAMMEIMSVLVKSS